MKKIDPISHGLWRDIVLPYVGRSKKRTKEALKLFESGPPMAPRSKHPLVKAIFKDGRGMDGLNAAGMTYGYLANLCRYHEKQLRAVR